MDVAEASDLAKKLMSEHQLEGWTFKLNNARRQLGVCKEFVKRIELSKQYVLHNDRAHIVDTILHEIAHALVGAKHGHDAVWKQMCEHLGCVPRACESTAVMPEGNWKAQCPSCFKTFSQHRKPKHLRGLYCRGCGPKNGPLQFSNAKLLYLRRVDKAAQGAAQQLMLKLF